MNTNANLDDDSDDDEKDVDAVEERVLQDNSDEAEEEDDDAEDGQEYEDVVVGPSEDVYKGERVNLDIASNDEEDDASDAEHDVGKQ